MISRRANPAREALRDWFSHMLQRRGWLLLTGAKWKAALDHRAACRRHRPHDGRFMIAEFVAPDWAGGFFDINLYEMLDARCRLARP
jgi:hypothetical protein